MKFKLAKILSLLLTTSLLLIGCNKVQDTNNINKNEDNTLNIVTSFYPIYISTLNIVKLKQVAYMIISLLPKI